MLDFKLFNKRISNFDRGALPPGRGEDSREGAWHRRFFFPGKNILKGGKLKMESPVPRGYFLESFTET